MENQEKIGAVVNGILKPKDEEINPAYFCKKPFPTQPKAVAEYYRKSPDVRRRMNKNPDDFADFWRNVEVSKYFDTMNHIRNTNWRNRRVLLGLLDECTDIDEKTRLQEMIDEFMPTDYLLPLELRGRDSSADGEVSAGWVEAVMMVVGVKFIIG